MREAGRDVQDARVTSRYPRVCFAVLLLLWQLLAGSLAHAAPASQPADCGHGHAAAERAAPEHTAPDAWTPSESHGSDCGTTQCNCPCGHTPALRLDLDFDRAVVPPVERRTPADEFIPPDPGEELFRPPG